MIYGEYSAESYTIYSGSGADYQPLYTAGNSPFESQGYLPAERGVGLDQMREFCIATAMEMSAELGEKFIGVEESEDE